MSAALPAGAEGEGASVHEGVGRVLALLRQALDLADSIKAPPELGARIQEVIDTLEQLQGRPESD